MSGSGDARLPPLLYRVFLAAWLVTFLGTWTYGVFASDIRGSAVSGRIENGRYFLRNRARLTEVSKDEWESRRFRERLDDTFGLLVLGGLPVVVWIGWLGSRRKQMVAKRDEL